LRELAGAPGAEPAARIELDADPRACVVPCPGCLYVGTERGLVGTDAEGRVFLRMDGLSVTELVPGPGWLLAASGDGALWRIE
jgi:hypothetical protein